MIESLSLFAIGASWGGTKSVVAGMDPPPPRTAKPWIDRGPIVRFSIGLESEAALWADLERALLHLASSEAVNERS
jgi:cystathionine beta-lyase